MNKKILLISLMLIVLCSLSAVSASEIDGTDDGAIADSEVLSASTPLTVTVSTWSDLSSACTNDTQYDTIYVNGGLSPESQIDISKSVTIEGLSGSYIGGSSTSNIATYNYIPIVSTSSDLDITLKNIDFQNSNGNILMKFSGNGNYVIENCAFTNINATGFHQSVIWLYYGNMDIIDSNFTNCVCSFGPVTNCYSSASATVNNAKMVVDNCQFKNNRATSEPGAINNCGLLNVNNSVFENNQAGLWAGAIHTHYYANTTIVNSSFKNNKAGYNGGALYTYSILNIYNSTFEGNNCTTNAGGGAIGASSFTSSYDITINNCIFTNNRNLNSAGYGGAISAMSSGNFHLYYSTFINNYATTGKAIAVREGVYYGDNDTWDDDIIWGNPVFGIAYNTFVDSEAHTNDVNIAYVSNNASYIAAHNNVFYTPSEYANLGNRQNSYSDELLGLSLDDIEIVGDSQDTPQWSVDGYDSTNSMESPYKGIDEGALLWTYESTTDINSLLINKDGLVTVGTTSNILFLNNETGEMSSSVNFNANPYMDINLFNVTITKDNYYFASGQSKSDYFDSEYGIVYTDATSGSIDPGSYFGASNDNYIDNLIPLYYENNGVNNIITTKEQIGFYAYSYPFDGSWKKIVATDDRNWFKQSGGFKLKYTPIIFNGHALFFLEGSQNVLAGFTLSDSSIIRYTQKFNQPSAIRPVSDGTNLFWLSDGKICKMVGTSTPTKSDVTGGIGSRIAVSTTNNALYSVNSLGTLYKYSLDDLTETELTDIGTTASTIMTDANGIIYVGSDDGKFYAFDDEGNQKWMVDTESTSAIKNCAMDNEGNIYVYTAENKVYAIGEPTVSTPIGFTQLDELITNNDVVDLKNNVILAEGENSKYSGGIPINKNVTINGNNHIINGTDLVRIFNIGNNSNVILNDLVITGARTTSGHGGAIYMATGSLTVENCTFVNNTLFNGGANGGAIYANTRTTLSIKDSKFINNVNTPSSSARRSQTTTQYGGAVYCADYVVLNVTNTLFKENTATRGSYSYRNMYGGAISSPNANSVSTITNCTFINNTATNGIGAIDIRVGNITGCIFDDNYGTSDFPTVYYEANGKGTVSYNVFLDNNINQIRFRNSFANDVEEYNWYATNDPANMVKHEGTLSYPNKYIMLDVYNEGNIIKAGFMKDSNRDDIPDISALPLREITISGDVNETAPKLVNGVATVEYTSEITPESGVSATIDGYTVDYTLALGNITNIDAIYVENTTVGDDGKIIIYAYGDNGQVNGDATIFLNDTKFDVTFANGVAILNVGSTLNAGIYDIYSYYLGSSDYTPTSSKIKSNNKFEIKKADVNITYTIDQNSGYITIKISDKVTPTGSTTAEVFGNSRTFSGTSIMYDSGARTLSNGTYLVNITYNGDINHNVCNLVEEVDFIKNNLTIDISREGTAFTFNLTNEYGIPTGSVVAKFEGPNTFSRTINLNNGVATYDFGSQLRNGTYNLTVTFNGDMKFEKATANGTYDINKLTATIDVDPIIIKLIQTNKNFVVTVVGAEDGPTPTGTVSYPSSWSSVSGTLNADGQATLNWQSWTDPYGTLMNQSTTISYSGDSNYDPTSIVVLLQTTPNLSISSAIDGNNITFSFSGNPNNVGTIYIKQNGEDKGNITVSGYSFPTFKDENLSMGIYNYEFIWDYGNGNNYTFTKSVELRQAGESQWAVPGFDNKNSGNPDYTRLDNGFVLWNATVNNPISSVVIDSQGNIYLADKSNVNIFFNNGTLKATSQGGSQGAISLIDDQYIIYVRPWSNIAGFDVGSFAGIGAYDTQVQWYTNTWYAPIKGEDGRIYLSVYFNNGGMPNGGNYLTMIGIEDNQFTYLNVMINKQPISSPVIGDNGILWLNTVGGLYGVDTSSDAVVFSNPNLGTVGRPVIDDANIVYVFGNDNTITALNAEGIVWNVTVNNGIGSVMAIDNENGLLYAVDQNGTLFSYNVNDAGAEVEVYNIGANATSIIVDGDSKVYVSDDAGNVWAFDSEGNLLWNLSLSAPVKAQLAMDNNGVIYAVTANTLYAIGYRNELAIEVTVSEGEYNVLDNVTITATLNETTEGNVIFTINGKNTTVAVNGTVAELTTTIPGGNQTIVATFEGNDAYMPTTGNATVDIAKLDVEFENVPEEDVIEQGSRYIFYYNIISNGVNVTTGTTKGIDENGKQYTSNWRYYANMGWQARITNIAAGNHIITIVYSGDDTYNAANKTFNLVVLPKVTPTATIDDDANEITVDVAISADDATGKFTVIANNETIAEGTIENGAGSVTFDKLEPGTYEFTIVYDGDDNYSANNATISVKIPRTSQWPSVGGNPQNSGIANATREDGVSIIWEAALNGDLHSSAIIDGLGNIYVNDGSKIYSFTSNGTLRWSGGIGSAGIALYKDELVLAPQYHNAMMIYNATTGAAINGNFWSASSNFAPITGPDGRIYTPTDYGYPADGQGWSGNYWISVMDETGYEWEPYGFNLFLVEITGVGYGSQALKASPSFDKLGYIYANTVKGFKIVNIATGATVFSDTNINGVGRPVIDSNNIAYILDATLNGIYAISTEGILWNATVSDAIGTTLAVDNENGFLYAVNANGTLYKYDTTDGSESLVYELNSTGVSIILDADSNVYVSTAAGDVVAISADGELLWTINLGSKVTGQLAMDNNGIIYAVADKTLYALGFDANMTVAGENVTVFDNEIITVTISAEGNVTISFNGEETEVPVENGTATLDLGQLPAGTYTVSVTYDGDGITYGPAFAETTFEIIKADAEITEDIVASVENSTLTLTLPEDATGIVLAKVDGKGYYAEIENGTAVIEIPELAPGKYPVDITYLGDDNYNNASLATELEVPEEPVVEPEDANVTADVNGTDVSVELPEDAEGYVVVSVDGKKYYFDADDEIALDLSDLAPGEYPVEIAYSGDDKYAPSTVNTTVTVPEEPVVEPEDANVTADVNGSDVSVELPEDAEGYVVVSVDGKKYYFDADDEIALDLSDLAPGEYPVEIAYSGDDKYASSTVNTTVTVPEVVPEDANISVSVENNTITVTADKNAIGNVLVDVNGTGYYAPLENGKATVEVIGLDEGTYDAKVTYTGDDVYAPVTKDVTVTVPKKEDPVTPEPVDSEAKVNVSEDSVSIELPEDATGYMLVDVDGTGYYVPVENGTATFDLPELAPGNHTVSVTYTGDKKYAPANSTQTLEVELKESIVSDDLTKVERAPERFAATFLDENGNPLANANVTFDVNGAVYTRTTDANGESSIAINLIAGNYTITLTNPATGEVKTNNITVLPRFVEDYDLVKYYRNDSQYVLKLLDDDGNPAKAGEIVTYNINGVFYNRTTNATGHVQLNINLQPGEYIITAIYKGCQVAHKVTVLPVLTATDLTKKFGQSGAFEAKLVDGQGKAYAGQSVGFNINGVFYNRTTDDNGIARLNINLLPGEYIITSSYGQALASNKVTVTA